MDAITLARALHILGVVHWIGGVAMVTLVLLPGLTRHVAAEARLGLFEMIEGRFAAQARISTQIVGATGFYMTHRLDAWDRFLHPADFWWMHLMVAIWTVFTFVLFVAEPLFLHRWFHARAARRDGRVPHRATDAYYPTQSEPYRRRRRGAWRAWRPAVTPASPPDAPFP